MKNAKAWWKICLFIFVFAAGIIVSQFIIPWATQVTSKWGTSELMAAIAIVAVFVSVFTPVLDNYFARQRDAQSIKDLTNEQHNIAKTLIDTQHAWEIEQKHSGERSVYLIDINIRNMENNYVRFSASIQNVGDVQIKTLISNLYIDQGVRVPLANDYGTEQSGVELYKFPFILQHKKESESGRPDCVLCDECFRNGRDSYPENFINEQELKSNKSLVRAHYRLRHLSAESIMYINPKEKFSEDVILHFSNPGVYRVTLFVGAADTADCSCATKQFVIPQQAKNEKIE